MSLRAWQVACLLVGLINVVAYIAVAIWFIQRSDLQPVRGRWPVLVLCGMSCLFCYFIGQIFVRLDFDNTTAAIGELPGFFVAPSLGFVIVRFTVFYIASRLAEEAEQLDQQQNAGRIVITSWYLSRKRWFCMKNYLLSSLVLTFIFVIPNAVIYVKRYSWLSITVQTDPAVIAWQFSLESLARYASIIVFLSGFLCTVVPKISRIHENLGLRVESWTPLICSVYTTCYFIPFFILKAMYPASPDFSNFCHAVFLWSGNAWIAVFITLVRPSMFTYRSGKWFKRLRTKSGASERDSSERSVKKVASPTSIKQVRQALLRVLKISQALQLFKKFCKEEFSLENVMFWEAVQAYRSQFALAGDNGGSSGELFECCQNVFKMFIAEDSPLMVNLSSKCRDALNLNFEKAGPANLRLDLFDDAEAEILDLLQRDTFARFKQTQDYKTILEDLDGLAGSDQIAVELGIH
eukprot:TRINITY_DN21577_c0_g2_i1.p1 TRINITY_DN21577_c0_g2~~TRINITY_DN21577_c0_g2_i1.p1  ORF type:complete len:464 (+),score=99.44 TRINITY_DN21577_c0_g2_i1:156-1547(+)